MDTTLRIPPPTHGNPASVTPKPGRHRAAILACAVLSLALGQTAKAAPGDLDPSFDADGLVLTHFGRIDDDSPNGRNDFASFVVVQPDGKLVVAGRSDASGFVFVAGFALARYNPDGTPDASFGTGGRVLTELPSAFGFEVISALIVQPDDKVVVAGQSDTTVPGGDFLLARYNPDGSLDASFGSGGLVVTDFGPEADLTVDRASALSRLPQLGTRKPVTC